MPRIDRASLDLAMPHYRARLKQLVNSPTCELTFREITLLTVAFAYQPLIAPATV